MTTLSRRGVASKKKKIPYSTRTVTEKKRRLQQKNFWDVSIVSRHFWTFREFNYEQCCEMILLAKEQKKLDTLS